ncbi:hypothetical protein WOLCODRAFT_165316 [Wolfiporia cocos MD-104 SS10]|uniref:Uncharacterized protein n=1 Tax=Wolfiporia cocos (strain MD-104) TaxID=742152 RepID=A0A2H3JR98_WOLCO|nr:hypothetical protein WOLCODRAFT_165316 [Wolfiporia cocos MD-104 SS10]
MEYSYETPNVDFRTQSQSDQYVYKSRNPFVQSVEAGQHAQQATKGEEDLPPYESVRHEDIQTSESTHALTHTQNFSLPHSAPEHRHYSSHQQQYSPGNIQPPYFPPQVSSETPTTSSRPYAVPALPGPSPHRRDTYAPSNVASSSAGRQAAPSSSQEAGFGQKLKHFAAGDSVRSLLDPPPPGFLRRLPRNLPYTPFRPAVLIGRGTKLSSGFPPLAPQCATVPHPFSTHGVVEEDWRRFVHDIGAAASLSGTERVVAAVAPLPLHLTIVGGFVVSKVIEKRMKHNKVATIGELIDTWNQKYFHPRYMHVVLARGCVAYSGSPNDSLPDMPGQRIIHIGHHDNGDNFSDDSSSSFSNDNPQSKGERRKQREQERHDRKEHRREDKAHKQEEKRRRKESKKQNFRLVVSYKVNN